MAGQENSATNGRTICNSQKKNPPRLPETFALAENSMLWSVTIFLENSAAGRWWSCCTPSLPWNYLESLFQCGSLYVPNVQLSNRLCLTFSSNKKAVYGRILLYKMVETLSL
jgi:hypothetical protein